MAKKWDCPTCDAPNIPKGMHCRSCLCDILCGELIGTSRDITRAQRKAARRKKETKQDNEFVGISDAVWCE